MARSLLYLLFTWYYAWSFFFVFYLDGIAVDGLIMCAFYLGDNNTLNGLINIVFVHIQTIMVTTVYNSLTNDMNPGNCSLLWSGIQEKSKVGVKLYTTYSQLVTLRTHRLHQ